MLTLNSLMIFIICIYVFSALSPRQTGSVWVHYNELYLLVSMCFLINNSIRMNNNQIKDIY